MPEGPEVKIISEALNSKLKGRWILRMDWNNNFQDTGGFGGWELMKTLFPFQIQEVSCKGKQIFFHLKHDNEYYYFNSFLALTGRWLWKKEKHSNFWVEIGKCISGSARIFTEKEIMLYYDDTIKFGHMFFLNEDEYQKKLKTTGLDVLKGITLEQLIERLKKKTWQNKKICEFLMEQKEIAGIGNYLKCDILYYSKIKPDRLIKNLTDEEIKELNKNINLVPKVSLENHGFTIKDYLDPNGESGRYVSPIYGKLTDPLGNPIVKEKADPKRFSYWVPNIQK